MGILVKLPGDRITPEEPLFRLADERASDLYLDCADVRFLGGLDLGTLVRLHRRARSKGRRLVLCKVRPLVYEIFQVTRLHTIFEVRQVRTPA
jgi:anti-sigma B factor antagonist